MSYELYKKFISVFVNYLILSLVVAFPYLLSQEMALVYAQTPTGESISISFPTSQFSWSRITGTSYFYLDNPVNFEVVFSGIGSSSNVRNVRVSYTIGGEEHFGTCSLSGSSSYSLAYSCEFSGLYGDTSWISSDANGKYLNLEVKVYYEFNTGSAWDSRVYSQNERLNLADTPNEEPISISLEGIENHVDFDADYYVSGGQTSCKISSLHDGAYTLINLTTNYPDPSDASVYAEDMLKNVSIELASGSSFDVSLTSSCSFVNEYQGVGGTILEFRCDVSNIQADNSYELCDSVPHQDGDSMTYSGVMTVKVNGQTYEGNVNGVIYFTSSVDITQNLEQYISVEVAQDTPFSWSVIPSKGYYYMDNNIPVKVTFNLPSIAVEDANISYDFDDYSHIYSCELQSQDSSSLTYLCYLPGLYGSVSYDVVHNHKLNVDVRVDYSIDYNGQGIERSKYSSLEINLDQQYQEVEPQYDISSIDFSDSLDFVGSVYYGSDGSSYCKINDVLTNPTLTINVSTNYMNPNDLNVNIKDILLSYPSGESNIPLSVVSSCSLSNVDALNRVLMYRCTLDDIHQTPFKLCSTSQVLEGSVLRYDGSLEVEILSGNNQQTFTYAYDGGNVEISNVVSELSLSSDASYDGEVSCDYYNNENVCVHLDDSNNLEEIYFNLVIHNLDPSYEVQSLSLNLNVDNSYYGSGDDYSFGGCTLEDRNNLDATYQCHYYLPLLNRDSTTKTISYDGILVYDNNEGEKQALITGSFDIPLNINHDSNAKIFMFLSNTSFEESQPQVWLSEGVEGGINCYVDPQQNMCYFGDVNVGDSTINYPLVLFVKGVAFTNIQEDNEVLMNVSLSVSTIPNQEFNVEIRKSDCVFDDFASFHGLYNVYCAVDLTNVEPFSNGIPYDPHNPPIIHINMQYATGTKNGEIIYTGDEQTKIEDYLLRRISTIDFDLLDVVFTKDIVDRAFRLSPDIALNGPSQGYPVCRIPVYVGKYLGEVTSCDDNDWQCIISNAGALSRAALENAYCKFDSGIWFVGKVSGIYNKSDFRFLTARYYLGDNSDVAEMSISPSTCIDRSNVVGGDHVCDSYYGDGSSSGCIVVDEGDPQSLLLLCPFERDLGKVLALDRIPSTTALAQDPLVVSISVEDNGYYRNGTDVMDFKYVIENSYNTLNNKINSLKQEQKHIGDRIKELKGIERRMLTVLMVIGGLDVAFGYKYRPIKILSFVPGPSLCLVGCLSCLPHDYGACTREAFKGSILSIKLNPFKPEHPGCGDSWCLPIIDAAFSCTLAGSMLIGKSLVSMMKNYRDRAEDLDQKILSLQELLMSGEDEVSDPLGMLTSYTSYLHDSLSRQGDNDKNSFARSWDEKLFLEGIPDWAKIIIGAGYGAICVKALTGAGKFVRGESSAIPGWLASGLFSMGVSATMQWVYRGKINLGGALISGASGAVMSYLSYRFLDSFEVSYGTYYMISLFSTLGVEAIRRGHTSSLDNALFAAGNFLFSNGIALAIQGAIEIAKNTPDIIRDTYNRHKEHNIATRLVEKYKGKIHMKNNGWLATYDEKVEGPIKGYTKDGKGVVVYNMKDKGFYVIKENSGKLMTERIISSTHGVGRPNYEWMVSLANSKNTEVIILNKAALHYSLFSLPP